MPNFQKINLNKNTLDSDLKEPSAALMHLEFILESYISKHNNISINGLSKKCGVSEATLRRIHSGNAKQVPTLTTVLRILSYISKETRHDELLKAFPGPLSTYLKSAMPAPGATEFLDETVDLSVKLKDPVKYLVYKMSANSSGVSKEKILERFGMFGSEKVEELLADGLIEEKRTELYFAKYKNFRLSHESFKEHFKATAAFIKPEKLLEASPIRSQVFYNYSESISIKAYEATLKVQRAALKKIRNILSDPKSKGDIPTFVIGAIDTLDGESASELFQKSKNKQH